MNAEATLRLPVAVEARCPARINSVLFNLAARIGQLPFAPVEVTAGPPA